MLSISANLVTNKSAFIGMLEIRLYDSNPYYLNHTQYTSVKVIASAEKLNDLFLVCIRNSEIHCSRAMKCIVLGYKCVCYIDIVHMLTIYCFAIVILSVLFRKWSRFRYNLIRT